MTVLTFRAGQWFRLECGDVHVWQYKRPMQTAGLPHLVREWPIRTPDQLRTALAIERVISPEDRPFLRKYIKAAAKFNDLPEPRGW